MTALAKLLPCPFCGGSAKLIEVEPSAYVVECTNGICNASTNIRFSCGDDARPLVIEQWNRRASPSSLAKLVEKWIARGYTSLPSDQMLINLHVRELQEALASPSELGGVEEGVEAIQRLLDCAELAVGFRGFQADDDNEVVVLRDAIREAKPHIVSLSTPRAAEAVTEEMVERACVVVARRAGECFNTLDEFTKSILRETQRAALTASLTPSSAKGE